MASNIVLSNTDYKVVGTRPIRHDGTDKVTGRAMYGADFQVAGELHGKILRSPHAHARIKSIDVSKALAHPGVKAVITGQDMPVARMERPDQGTRFASDNHLARDKVLYRGHAVAAVAATNPHVAAIALGLIRVEYEVLPPVVNVLDAMKDDAPLLHEDLTTDELGERSSELSNVATHFRYELGDLEEGLEEADIIVEREYTTATVHQGYIEPHSATALWNADGQLTIWCSTQGAFGVREAVAPVLDVPVSRIKVVPMEVGGGFGGKAVQYLEPLAALLSQRTGQPVKMVMTRGEVFESTGPTSGTYMRVKMGVNKAGKITAADAYLAFEAGAYPGSMVAMGALCMFSPYDVENLRVDGYDVVVNKPKTGAYRAPAAPNGAFAVETLVDELAEKLGMDPIEFRLSNAAKEGTRRIDGVVFRRIGNVECLEAAKSSGQYETALEGSNRGRGVASGFWFNIGFHSSCSIAVNADGTISLVSGSTDLSGSRVSLAMQAAEVLGISAEDVRPGVGDTESVGYTFLTGGSRTTFASGWAVHDCAQDIKAKMVQRAATIWDVPSTDVDLVDGVFQHKSDPDLRMTFKDMAAKLNDTGGPVSSQVSVDPKGVGESFATHVVDVEVDPETGKVTILNYTAVQDAGKAVHPSYVEGQMQGGAVQGVGWALNEEYFFNRDGRMENATFLDYRMPTSLDLPMINTVIVEVANPGHPYGVRGVGEVPLVPPMAAIANAIANATGVRFRDLPMSPGVVLDALREKGGNPAG